MTAAADQARTETTSSARCALKAALLDGFIQHDRTEAEVLPIEIHEDLIGRRA
jgi:hypothetical protein